jgi:flagellar FliL protein
MTMSAAAAAPTVADAGTAAPAKKGKKKLLIIVAAALLLVLLAGAGAAVYLKKRAAHAAEGDDVASAAAQARKPDLKHPPTFLPLDPFVVNLADRDADRYAQIGITFEVADAHFSEEMKAFMPAIRNGILMILSHKASRDLLDRAGKEQLASEILRDASRTMGLDVAEPASAAKGADADAPAEAAADDEDPKPRARPRPAKPDAEPNPIRHVHFSNFIVQ